MWQLHKGVSLCRHLNNFKKNQHFLDWSISKCDHSWTIDKIDKIASQCVHSTWKSPTWRLRAYSYGRFRYAQHTLLFLLIFYVVCKAVQSGVIHVYSQRITNLISGSFSRWHFTVICSQRQQLATEWSSYFNSKRVIFSSSIFYLLLYRRLQCMCSKFWDSVNFDLIWLLSD